MTLRLNRRTVKREVEAEGPRRYAQRAKPRALSEAQVAHVERRLAVCPSIRGTDLFGELQRDYAYAGSYATFQRQLRQIRPAAVRDPEVRFETAPGVQTQADWAHLGLFPLGDEMAELHAMVAILGCSRAPAVRFATDCTRRTSLERLVTCLDDLGGATHEMLTDRDTAFCVGSTGDGRAILAPEWVDLAGVLGVVPKACRPYRAKTKGKVERMVREVKESFLARLSGQRLQPPLQLEIPVARLILRLRLNPNKDNHGALLVQPFRGRGRVSSHRMGARALGHPPEPPVVADNLGQEAMVKGWGGDSLGNREDVGEAAAAAVPIGLPAAEDCNEGSDREYQGIDRPCVELYHLPCRGQEAAGQGPRHFGRRARPG